MKLLTVLKQNRRKLMAQPAEAIDRVVYLLVGLTEQEIALVEGRV